MNKNTYETLVENAREIDSKLWQLIAAFPGSANETIGFIEKLARNQLDAAQQNLLNTLIGNVQGPMTPQDFAVIAAKFLAKDGGKYAEKIRILLANIGDMAEQNPPPILKWSPLDFSREGNVKLLNFKLEAGADVVFTGAGMFDPDGDGTLGDAPAKRMTHFSVKGQLGAGVDTQLPLNRGTASVSAAASASAELIAHYIAKSSDVFAGAAAKLLSCLGNPFDLTSLCDSLAIYGQDGLQGYTLKAGSQLSVGVDVSLVSPIDLLNGELPAVPKLSVTANIARNGEISVSTYKEAFDSITVVLSSAKKLLSEVDIALGITIDPGQLLDKANIILKQYLGDFDELLQQFETYLQPSEIIRQKLKEEMQQHTFSESLQPVLPLLNAALGFDQSLEDATNHIDILAKLLADKATQRTSLFSGSAEGRANQAINSLLADYPLLSATGIADNISNAVKAALESFDTELKTKVDGLSGKARNAVVDSIKRVNEQSGELYGRIDDTAADLLGPIKQVLERYHAKLRELSATIEKAAKSKLTARLYAEYKRESGTIIELKCQIRKTAPMGQELLEKLYKGNTDTVIDILQNIGAAKYQGINVVDGEVRRFAKLTQTLGFEVLFMDIALSNVSIMTASASITYDHKGQVSILSDSEYKNRVRVLGEERLVTFLSAYQLVAARQLQQLNAGLTLSHKDDDLEPKEAEKFFTQLEQKGLVEPGTTNRATQLLQSWIQSSNGKHVEAEIGLVAPLTQRYLLALMKADNDVIAKHVVLAYQQVINRKYFAEMAGVFAGHDKEISALELGRRLRLLDHITLTGSDAQRVEDHINACHLLIISFIAFVGSMRDIYNAPASWKVNEYLAAEKNLNGSIKNWLKANPALFADTAGNKIVAFLLTLKGLAKQFSMESEFDISIQMIQNSDSKEPLIQSLG